MSAGNEDYTTTDTCDGCGEHAEGTMYHAEGATGRICPVLFLCFGCQKPKGAEEPKCAA